jgi:hypothetical protein
MSICFKMPSEAALAVFNAYFGINYSFNPNSYYRAGAAGKYTDGAGSISSAKVHQYTNQGVIVADWATFAREFLANVRPATKEVAISGGTVVLSKDGAKFRGETLPAAAIDRVKSLIEESEGMSCSAGAFDVRLSRPENVSIGCQTVPVSTFLSLYSEWKSL